jgi:hypothetical protein
MNLRTAVAVLESAWPTPTVRGNYNKVGASATSGDGLATAVTAENWSTPMAADSKDVKRMGAHLDSHPSLTAQAKAEAPGCLNPDWVELLMGFPVSWTRVGPQGADSRNTPTNRRGRSRPAPIETEAAA